MTDFVTIGSYQLANLLANNVKFLYLDLRSEAARLSDVADVSWFVGSHATDEASALELVRRLMPPALPGGPNDSPIILICETGAKSSVVASLLAKNSFINVFVIDGGSQALPAHRPA